MPESRADGTPGVRRRALAPDRSLPVLRLADASTVLLHEESDGHRTAALMRRLRDEGMLRNPPIGVPAGSGYVVLDGANRVTALRRLGYPYVLLQVVDYGDPRVRLEVWRHLLLDVDAQPLIGALATSVGVPAERVPRGEAGERLARGDALCVLDDGQGDAALLRATGSLTGDAAALARVVGVYTGDGVYRVMEDDFEALRRTYGNADLLVRFPPFTKEQILAVGRGAVRLPAGVTRHVIPGRALRVNVGLDLLRGDAPLEAQNTRLEELIHARLLEHKVRHYPEPTFLFDE